MYLIQWFTIMIEKIISILKKNKIEGNLHKKWFSYLFIFMVTELILRF